MLPRMVSHHIFTIKAKVVNAEVMKKQIRLYFYFINNTTLALQVCKRPIILKVDIFLTKHDLRHNILHIKDI